MKINKRFPKHYRYDLLFAGGMLAIFLLYLYKVVFEIRGNDEAFYLTSPLRILQGDTFVVDEWHGGQFSALLVVPIMALRNLFTADTQGIVLQFRYIYVIVNGLFCLLIYCRLRKYGLAAVLVSLMFFMFTPYSITALCYNTMGLMSVCASTVVLATAKNKWDYAFGGLFFSAAVLCCPFLILPFGAVFAGGVMYAWIKKKKQLLTQGLFFVLGCLPLLCLLLLFIFTRTTPAEFLQALPAMFTDPEHPSTSLLGHVKKYIVAFRFFDKELVCYALLLCAIALDKKRVGRKILYFLVSVFLALGMLVHCIWASLYQYHNFIMIPLSLPGFVAFLLTEKKDWRVFCFLFLGGIAYSFCINMGSNQSLFVISSALSVTTYGGILFISAFLREVLPARGKGIFAWATVGCVAVLLICQLSSMTFIKVNHKYWSAFDNSELTEVISGGPYAGIHVVDGVKVPYEAKLQQLDTLLGSQEQGSVLFLDEVTWYYLHFPNFRNGAYSAWLSGVSNTTVDRLAAYYQLESHELPDFIYIGNPDNVDMAYLQEKLLTENYVTAAKEDFLLLRKR